MPGERFDAVVVGSGPGGYVAAIRAAQLGRRVAVVEADRPGGICLNWGCIPTKALLRNAEVLQLFQRAGEFGVSLEGLRADYAVAHARSRQVAERMSRGVEYLFRKRQITLIPGRGTLLAPGAVRVAAADGSARTVEAAAVVLATGARPKSLPGVAIDGVRVISSDEALRLDRVPPSIVVIGAGAVGVEFADVFASYGTQVTVVEALPRLLPLEDEEISRHLARSFAKRKIDVRAGARVQSVRAGGDAVRVEIEHEGQAARLEAAMVLMAVGRGANTGDLGLEALGVTVARGFVQVSPRMETSVPGVYAIGDVAGPPLLAHKASAEGIVAAEALAGAAPGPLDYRAVPSCTYCHPQVASLGLTEAQARADGRAVRVGRYMFVANGKAQALGEPEGLVKIVAAGDTGEILGVHVIGAEATELIAELALGKTLEATVEEVGRTIHAHPTMAEAVMEAALDAMGEAIHL
ncbi:MAG TPA: dihydrolipoyl dehydrogenase [Methylomirabilota bacterium]|jgi:dihydrolipoamide dehydrogenase|nr:dihydrolipoyl dehydrogenase [Methylomirabilota bacterium]